MSDNVLGFPHGKRPGDYFPCDVEPPCEGTDLLWKQDEHGQLQPAVTQDVVNHPPHYNQRGVETIDIIEHVIADYPPISAFQVSQVLKYLCRAPYKDNFAQDLEKAHWYLSRLIRRVRVATPVR